MKSCICICVSVLESNCSFSSSGRWSPEQSLHQSESHVWNWPNVQFPCTSYCEKHNAEKSRNQKSHKNHKNHKKRENAKTIGNLVAAQNYCPLCEKKAISPTTTVNKFSCSACGIRCAACHAAHHNSAFVSYMTLCRGATLQCCNGKIFNLPSAKRSLIF